MNGLRLTHFSIFGRVSPAFVFSRSLRRPPREGFRSNDGERAPPAGVSVGDHYYLAPERCLKEDRVALYPDALLPKLFTRAPRGLGGSTESIPPLPDGRPALRLL